MNLNNRIEKLEAVTQDESKKNYMTLGELYDWQETPEGKAELDKLYNENRYEPEQ